MTDQPDTLTDRIRRVLAEADGFRFETLEPHDYQRHAAAVLALFAAEQAPPADRAALRDRITEVIRRELDPVTSGPRIAPDAIADAVLADWPEPANRAAVLSASETHSHGARDTNPTNTTRTDTP